MFAVLGYLDGQRRDEAALETARHHLTAGGLLLADVWYGTAVLARATTGAGRGDRDARRRPDHPRGDHELDSRRNICTVDYRLWRIQADHVSCRLANNTRLRYFFEPELEAFLSAAGFRFQRLARFRVSMSTRRTHLECGVCCPRALGTRQKVAETLSRLWLPCS